MADWKPKTARPLEQAAAAWTPKTARPLGDDALWADARNELQDQDANPDHSKLTHTGFTVPGVEMATVGGAGAGFLKGWADEGAGLLNATKNLVSDTVAGRKREPGQFDVDRKFQQDFIRQNLKATEDKYPKAYGTGELVGDLTSDALLAGATGGANLTPAGQGVTNMVQSLGASQDKSFADAAENAAVSGAMGVGFSKLGQHAVGRAALTGLGLAGAAYGDKVGLGEKERTQMGLAGGLGVLDMAGRVAGKHKDSAVGEIAAKFRADDEVAAKKAASAGAAMDAENARSKEAGLRKFEKIQKRLTGDGADEASAQAAERKALLEKIDTEHAAAGKQKSEIQKAYDKAVGSEAKDRQSKLDAMLKERAARKSMSRRESDKATVQAFQAEESAKAAKAQVAQDAEDAADKSLVESFQHQERQKMARTGTDDAQPDLDASAVGILGNRVQENHRYLRSKDPLGLKLTPEAEAGVGNLLPDYEAKANESLAAFAKGKSAVLEQIKAELAAKAAAEAAAKPRALTPDTEIRRPDPKLLEESTGPVRDTVMGTPPEREIESALVRKKTPRDHLDPADLEAVASELGVDPKVVASADADPRDLVTSDALKRIAKETGADQYEFGGRDIYGEAARGAQVAGPPTALTRPAGPPPTGYEPTAPSRAARKELAEKGPPIPGERDWRLFTGNDMVDPLSPDAPSMFKGIELAPEPKAQPRPNPVPADRGPLSSDAPMRPVDDLDFHWDVPLEPEPVSVESRVADSLKLGNALPAMKKAALDRIVSGRGLAASAVGALRDPALRANTAGFVQFVLERPTLAAKYGEILGDNVASGGEALTDKLAKALAEDPDLRAMYQRWSSGSGKAGTDGGVP